MDLIIFPKDRSFAAKKSSLRIFGEIKRVVKKLNRKIRSLNDFEVPINKNKSYKQWLQLTSSNEMDLTHTKEKKNQRNKNRTISKNNELELTWYCLWRKRKRVEICGDRVEVDLR